MEFAAKILLNSKTYRKEGKEILLLRMDRSNLRLETTNNYLEATNFTLEEADKLLRNPIFRTALNHMNVEQNRRRNNLLKPCLFTKGWCYLQDWEHPDLCRKKRIYNLSYLGGL